MFNSNIKGCKSIIIEFKVKTKNIYFPLIMEESTYKAIDSLIDKGEKNLFNVFTNSMKIHAKVMVKKSNKK